MNHRKRWTGTFSLLGMLVLILDGKTAISAAQSAIDLCIRTLIPSLFPFFLLSILLTGSFSGMELPWLRPIGKLLGIPKGGESLLLCGFLGGYPTGAQAVSQAYRSGALEKGDADRLLAFCNNAGPSFLFGVVGCLFPEQWMVWALWGIHIASAGLTALCFPGQPGQMRSQILQQPLSPTQALQAALRVMATVCGWVILFRVLMGFVRRWFLWMFPETLQVLLIGCLELSNGCLELLLIEDIPLRFLLCSGMLAFGGLCVMMQTASVSDGLSLRYSYWGTGLRILFSTVLSYGMLNRQWLAGLLCAMIPIGCRYLQKRSSIPEAIGV